MSWRKEALAQPQCPGLHPEAGFIRVEGLGMSFGDRIVLDGVDLDIHRGEVFVIMGPSGCGKTTMMRHLCGLTRPTRGSVVIEGQDVFSLAPSELRTLRLRTGLAFQGGALLGSLSVLENVALPLRENTDLDGEFVLEIARMKLEMVGLLHAADLLPASLSGGMKKRAAIARAIALDPEILFFDEPSAGLDPVTAAEVDNLICKLNQVFGITTIVVTHDLPSAQCIADRVAVFFDGRVAAVGEKEHVWHHQDERIRDFIERRMREADERDMDIATFMAM
ncbi:MAG: ATP-binding cassette domain-containing protein [Planctomycetes bacterium]|nr:ATP-binding cassette domain-containing protein [Planctomycetota bacterium]